MSNRIVRAVRAWAEYDGWQILTNKEMVPGGFARYAWPTTGNGEPVGPAMCSGVAHAIREGVVFGPLRSVRVLYDNGYELKLRSRDGAIPGTSESSTLWDWGLSAPLTPGVVYALPGPVASGSFPEDKDSEAVERAMIAAAAWFTQAEPIGS